MPTKYTSAQLAQHVSSIINTLYGNPLSIKAAFHSKLNTVAKSLAAPRQLIDSELEELTGRIAVDIYGLLDNISLGYIEHRMSIAIKNESYYNGIELATYEVDFRNLAKTIVGDLIKQRVKQVKDAAKPAKPKAVPKRTTPKKPKKR